MNAGERGNYRQIGKSRQDQHSKAQVWKLPIALKSHRQMWNETENLGSDEVLEGENKTLSSHCKRIKREACSVDMGSKMGNAIVNLDNHEMVWQCGSHSAMAHLI
jgi:hypothetical protein